LVHLQLRTPMISKGYAEIAITQTWAVSMTYIISAPTPIYRAAVATGAMGSVRLNR